MPLAVPPAAAVCNVRDSWDRGVLTSLIRGRRASSPLDLGVDARSSLPHEVTGVTSGVLLQVILVVTFGVVPGRGRLDCGGDWPTPTAGCCDASLHSLRRLLLRSVLRKDRGAVLRPDIVALTIERGWIVQLEEPLFEQVFVTNDGRIERDPNGLGVT